MRKILILSLMLAGLCSCERVGSNPWKQVNYAEAGCGTKDAILTTAGCVTKPNAPAQAVTYKASQPANQPNNANTPGDDASADQNHNGTLSVHGTNANSTIQGTNANNTVYGTGASNNIHGNNAGASVFEGNTNYNTTTTALGSNLDNYHTNTGVYGNETNTGSVYGNAGNVGNSTNTGVEGPVTEAYGANGTNSVNASSNNVWGSH